jgi:branched-chain amino acid transport system permease protein
MPSSKGAKPKIEYALRKVKEASLGLVRGINLGNAIIIIMLLVILVVFPFLLHSDYYLSILRDVVMWVALSMAWHFFSGSTKYISLGSAAFFGIGLYSAAIGIRAGLPGLAVALLTIYVNFALALVVGIVSLRLRGIYFAILTFSASNVVMYFVQWVEIIIVGTRGTYVPIFFDSLSCYYAILVCAIFIVSLTTLLRRSKFGLALKMIGENEEAAVHVGVNASLYKTLAFAISATLIGLMGASFVTRLPYISTETAFDPQYSFLPAVMTLLGGIGSVFGPIVGAVFLTVLEDILSVTLVHYFLILLGAILVIIIILLPNGLIGLAGWIKTTKPPESKRRAKTPEKKAAAKAPEKPP